MIISKITDNRIAYYYLHAEVAYIKTESDVLVSIDTFYLPKSVIDFVCKDIIEDTQSSTFVLDFDGIESVQVNAFEEGISDLCNVHGKIRQILCFFTLFCYKGLAQIKKKEYNTYKQVL